MPAKDLRPLVKRDQVIEQLTSGGKVRPAPSALRRIDGWLGRIGRLAHPRLAFRRLGIERLGPGQVILEPDVSLRSAKLARTLKGSEEALCFVLTLGRGLEERIRRLTARRKVRDAVLLDTVASLYVEQMVEGFQRRMERQLARQGKGVTLRFSPGYCDWPVTEQKSLFRAMPSGSIGVKLLDSCLMSPGKTVSGIFGIYDRSRVRGDYVPCLDCARNCNHRRMPNRREPAATAA